MRGKILRGKRQEKGVRLMYTNADCTVYAKTDDGYETIHVEGCYWQQIKAAETKKYGAENADSIKAIIPLEYTEGLDRITKSGSYIAKGAPDIVITDSIEPLIDYPVYEICSVTDHRSGSEDVQHITVCGK